MEYSSADHLFFERRRLWHCAAGVLHICGAVYPLTFNFASARIKCFSSFYMKMFATISCQYIVEKLWRKIEFEDSIEDWVFTIVQKYLKIALITYPNLSTFPVTNEWHLACRRATTIVSQSLIFRFSCTIHPTSYRYLPDKIIIYELWGRQNPYTLQEICSCL